MNSNCAVITTCPVSQGEMVVHHPSAAYRDTFIYSFIIGVELSVCALTAPGLATHRSLIGQLKAKLIVKNRKREFFSA